MSQGIFDTIVPSTTSGNQLATLLNDWKNAVVSGNSGTSRPSQLQAGGYWIDVTNNASGTWDYKIYDGVQDITVFTLNKNTGFATMTTADTLFSIAKLSEDSIGPILRLLKERVSDNGQTEVGDTLGEVQFSGTRDDGVSTLQARIKSISQNNVTALQQGAYLAFEISTLNGASISEVMRLIDGKVSIGGIVAPTEKLHVLGNGLFENESDTASGPSISTRKKRIATAVLNGDTLGSIEFKSTEELAVEVDAAVIEVKATENHSSGGHGSKISIKNKKIGQTAYTEQVVIGEAVVVKTDLTVEGNFTVTGTTTSVNSATLNVVDANISVNKNGTQSSANTNKAGLKVEMSDATHAQIGYDSSKASKFVVGEIGSEKEIVDVSSSQTLLNKTLTGASVNDPSRLDAKKDTFANLTTYATTASDGQFAFATDVLKMYQVVGGVLTEFGGGVAPESVAIPGFDIDWSSGRVFYKDVSTAPTFTFSNIADGKDIIVSVRNTGGSSITVTFPTTVKDASFSGLVSAGRESIFTFVRYNGKTAATVVSDLV